MEKRTLPCPSYIKNGSWDLGPLELVLPRHITDTIYATFIPDIEGMEDKNKCTLVTNNRFHTSKAYQYVHSKEKRNVQCNKNFTWIWKLHCPAKMKYFIWLLYHNKLPTAYYLQKIGMNVDPVCFYCQQTETLDQILRSCPKVLIFWRANNMGTLIEQSRQLSTKDWLRQCNRAKNLKIGSYLTWHEAFPFLSLEYMAFQER